MLSNNAITLVFVARKVLCGHSPRKDCRYSPLYSCTILSLYACQTKQNTVLIFFFKNAILQCGLQCEI